ncbi:thiamine pyrophosphate-dependent enzyme [Patescibacteria group bacterium]
MRQQKLLDLFKEIYLIRRVEERVIELAKEGYVNPLVHLSIGQEACAVGMCQALKQIDYVWSNHRCHAHYLAKGGNLARMFAELAGKENGCAGGWGGSMHLVDPAVNMMGSSSIVGSSIPLAAGSALASKLREDERVSVVFMGDGAVEEGAFWETLNFSVVHNLPIIFFCENNLYATHLHISKRQPKGEIIDRVGSFGIKTFSVDGNDVEAVYQKATEAVSVARGCVPVFIEAKTYRWREHWGFGEDDSLGYRSPEEIANWKEKCPIKLLEEKIPLKEITCTKKAISKKIDQAWLGAVTEENVDIVAKKERNFTVHSSERELSYREAVEEAYLQAMEADPEVFLLGEGVDGIAGIYGTTLHAFSKFGPNRVIDTPLSEVAITGIAIGSAIAGMRPVIMHQRMDFLLLALSQVVHTAASWKSMTGGRLSCPVTIRAYIARKPGEGAQHTGAWHSIFGHIPGLKTVMPSNSYDVKGLTVSAIFDDDPVLILEHRDLNESKSLVPDGLYKVPIGESRIIREGMGITIVSVSAEIEKVLEAAGSLGEKNISVEVIDLVSVRPIDKRTIISSVEKTGKLLVVDTGFPTYGVSAEICAIVVEEVGMKKKSVRRMGTLEFPAPASKLLLGNYHPSVGQIITTVLEMVGS